MLRQILSWNVKLSQRFDQLLPTEYTIDGNSDFQKRFAPQWLKPNTTVVDVGGGKNPFIGAEKKKELALDVTGVDINSEELARAPSGAYDRTVCGDIAAITGHGDMDVCLCQAVLEHVRDVDAAFLSIASFLRPGGIAIIFVPSRNAIFARLNLLLPERLKRLVLFGIFPQTRHGQGFPSYYDKCTPHEFRVSARAVGLEFEQVKYYYCSTYFSFFAPLHIMWRLWVVLFRSIAGEQAAETFSVALRKTAEHSPQRP
jgi:SAM-dependent methyltransferase